MRTLRRGHGSSRPPRKMPRKIDPRLKENSEPRSSKINNKKKSYKGYQQVIQYSHTLNIQVKYTPKLR